MRSVLATLLLATTALLGCRARVEAPICTAKQACAAGEACIDGACQACRADADCAGQRCVEFRCTADPNACEADAQCSTGLRCVDAKCRECTDASACESGICHASGRCEPLPCASDDACPADEYCDGGQCIASVSEADEGPCGVRTIVFARDSAKLSPTHQLRLVDASACLLAQLSSGSGLTLEADAGDDEDLGRARAETLRSFLISRGVPADRLFVSISSAGFGERVHIVSTTP